MKRLVKREINHKLHGFALGALDVERMGGLGGGILNRARVGADILGHRF